MTNASALALLQEEELDSCRKRSVSRDFTRGSFRAGLGFEKSKPNIPDKPQGGKIKTDKHDVEEKLQTLKNFRRKNGLCFKCGEKWSHNHKCPPQVSIHVIEELLDALEQSEDTSEHLSDIEEVDTVMAINSISLQSKHKRRTMKLYGKVGHQDVLILVDSGSVGSFISDKLASKLQ